MSPFFYKKGQFNPSVAGDFFPDPPAQVPPEKDAASLGCKREHQWFGVAIFWETLIICL